MNAQIILTSVKNNAAYVARIVGFALLLFVLLQLALSAFILGLDAFWQQDSARSVLGSFLGLCFLYVARLFWWKLLKAL